MGGKNRVQVRADLRLDLKDSGSLWSNDELDRSLELSVSDLSRMLPMEMIHEVRLGFTVTAEAFTSPIDTAATRIVNAADISATSSGDTLALANQPDHARILTLTIVDADASITDFAIIVKGTDVNDKSITETFHLGAGLTQTGKKEFKYVREVEVDRITGNGASDTLSIGVGGFEGVWVQLANKPIKYGTGDGIDSFTRGTDYEMDYRNGRIKAISGGSMAANTAYTINYTKSQIGLDLSSLPDLIRVERVEYLTGEVIQTFVQWDIWGKVLYVTGLGESEGQRSLREDAHIAVYYAAEHQPPTDYFPGSYPEFLENTVLIGAGGYALYIYALKQEHQAATDLASSRTALASANTAHTALGTALTSVKKYLDNNSEADAVGILKDITDDIAGLRTAILTALDAANTYLDDVAGDLTSADGARANYMGATNYVDGGTAPDVKKYLDEGDAILNSVAVGGEGTDVPIAYARFAQATRDALVAPHEQDRSFYLEDARARTNAGLGFTQEAAQRLANLRTYIDQAGGYTTIAALFAREAEVLLAEIAQYMQQASGYANAAASETILADRFRTEANAKLDMAYAVWKDRKQYIGDFTQSSLRQMPSYD